MATPEKETDTLVDRTSKNIKSDHLAQAIHEVHDFYKSHDSNASNNFTNRLFNRLGQDNLLPQVARDTLSGSAFQYADSDKSGTLSKDELNKAGNDSSLPPFVRLAMKYGAANIDHLSGGKGQISDESLNRAATTRAASGEIIPSLAIVEDGKGKDDSARVTVKQPDTASERVTPPGAAATKETKKEKEPAAEAKAPAKDSSSPSTAADKWEPAAAKPATVADSLEPKAKPSLPTLNDKFDRVTISGAHINEGKDGKPEQVVRSNNSSVAVLDSSPLGPTKIAETDAQGKTVTWKRDSASPDTWRSDDEKAAIRKNFEIEKNGNTKFETTDGTKHIIRGNGTELTQTKDSTKYHFDDQGRFQWLEYPDRNNLFGFSYKGNSEEIAAVYTHDRSRNHTATLTPNHAWGEPKISGEGNFSFNSYQQLNGSVYKMPQLFNADGSESHQILMADGSVKATSISGNEATRPWSNQRDEQNLVTTEQPAATTRGDKTEGSGAERTDTSLHLRDYILPSPDQLGAGSCLYMTATGIAEFLLNKARGIRRPRVGGETDLSEQWTLALSQRMSLQNNYTDAVDLLTRGGTVPDSRLKFRAYASSSWMGEGQPAVAGGDVSHNLPKIDKQVLFTAGGEGSQLSNGIMNHEHLGRIKAFLRRHESPVLFVYKPPGTNWWHANMITGFDDKKQTFTVRDSSFGQKVGQTYNYDGRSPWGAQQYRGETEMSYADALRWGNHATGYKLAQTEQVVQNDNQR